MTEQSPSHYSGFVVVIGLLVPNEMAQIVPNEMAQIVCTPPLQFIS